MKSRGGVVDGDESGNNSGSQIFWKICVPLGGHKYLIFCTL